MNTWRFARSEKNRMAFGVAGGLSDRLGVDSAFVRLGFALLTIDLGLGALLYFLASQASFNTNLPGQTASIRPITNRHNLGFCLLLLAALFAVRGYGFWIGDSIMWPATLVSLGATVIVLRSDSDASRWETSGVASVLGSRPSRVRLAAGTLFVAFGVASFLVANHASTPLGRTLLAVFATAAGLLMILTPWLSRVGRQLMDERRQGIRARERAEMGAHLHDSVLQTLAMIQRAGSPEHMASLARQQERDLRAWLQAKEEDTPITLNEALESVAANIDRDHQVAVNIVVVGDRILDSDLRPLVAATQEAMTNAARHSGARTVHVYVEITNDMATSLIRDEGKGFDVNTIAPDRQGISQSIQGRLQRHGGEATIRSTTEGSTTSSGTEVSLRLPLQKREW